jgi:hypothetical protein
VVYTNAPIGLVVPCAGLDHAADTHLDLGVAREEHVVKDPILDHVISQILELQLVRYVASSAAVGTGSILIKLVPCYEAFFQNGSGPRIIHGDIIWERLMPAIMGHVLDVVKRGTANVKGLVLAVVQGANIVRLAVVIP